VNETIRFPWRETTKSVIKSLHWLHFSILRSYQWHISDRHLSKVLLRSLHESRLETTDKRRMMQVRRHRGFYSHRINPINHRKRKGRLTWTSGNNNCFLLCFTKVERAGTGQQSVQKSQICIWYFSVIKSLHCCQNIIWGILRRKNVFDINRFSMGVFSPV